MKTLAFFSNKCGIGTTTLVYHLAWMFRELGVSTLAVDLDPQANLTEAFLPNNTLQDLWVGRPGPRSILEVIQPILNGLGDVGDPVLQEIEDHLALLPGHLGLSCFEDCLAKAWHSLRSRTGEDADSVRVTTAFSRATERAARLCGAELALVDIGPSLGALSRSALVTCDYVIFPLGANLYSLQALRNLAPALEEWRKEWGEHGQNPPVEPTGYVILQHTGHMSHPIKPSRLWIERLPAIYYQEVLRVPEGAPLPDPDLHKLATLKPYRSLMLLAQDARKPMFLLKPADGAIGSHSEAVLDCYRDFKSLALRIAAACGIATPALSKAY